MRAGDNEYTREVSRLIFAGGIHRLYNPGCKFDEMPVLIGTSQGEGKSTIVRWLNMSDEFFGEVTEFEGQRGIEALEGAWICEVSELLAMTKTKDVEAVKSYLTRQNDRYRMPFDKRVTEHKRKCIFIGTTNKEQFLTDKTGNRRFYPVRVWQQGYNLYEKEKEIKHYIEQCWAEALILYEKGELKPYVNPDLIELVRKKQSDATQDDYRVGMIKDFLESKQEVCIPMLWYEALGMRGDLKPTRKDSNEIALIMQSMAGWERKEVPKRFKDYALQRYWTKEWEEL
jgi:predicted P-loop ATPase